MKNTGLCICVIVGAVLAMKLGDLIYPAGVEELGFRVFGAAKGAVGALIGMALWQIGSRIAART